MELIKEIETITRDNIINYLLPELAVNNFIELDVLSNYFYMRYKNNYISEDFLDDIYRQKTIEYIFKANKGRYLNYLKLVQDFQGLPTLLIDRKETTTTTGTEDVNIISDKLDTVSYVADQNTITSKDEITTSDQTTDVLATVDNTLTRTGTVTSAGTSESDRTTTSTGKDTNAGNVNTTDKANAFNGTELSVTGGQDVSNITTVDTVSSVLTEDINTATTTQTNDTEDISDTRTDSSTTVGIINDITETGSTGFTANDTTTKTTDTTETTERNNNVVTVVDGFTDLSEVLKGVLEFSSFNMYDVIVSDLSVVLITPVY